MRTEYDTLMKNQTWNLVSRPNNKKILTNRWVFKTKRNQNGEIYKHKARLVVRGHTQVEGVDFQKVFASVARYETIRTLLATAVNEKMHVHQMNVISAYGQSTLNDEVYMEQPEMIVQEN